VKRILLLILVIVLGIGMVIMGCGGAPPAEEEEEEEERTVIELDFGTFWPAVDFQVTMGHKEWAKAISDLVQQRTTKYSVKWYWYYSISPGALRTGAQNGTYDVITSGPGYYAGVYPLWEGPEFPASTTVVPRKNAYTMSMALQKLWDESTALQQEFAAKEPSLKVMHYWSTGPGYFLMVAGKNVTVLEDFAGKKIRAANPASVKCIEALGGTPQYMPMSAALLAFQAGTIDGILCPTDTPKGFGLSAYVRSCTYAPFSYQFVFYKLMNKATYDGLPAEVRAIVDEVNAKYADYYGKLRTWGEHDGLVFCRSSLGAAFSEYNLPVANPTEYQRWLDAVYPSLINAWIAGDAAKQELWNKFTTIAQWADATYGGWTHSYPTPPPPPTFP